MCWTEGELCVQFGLWSKAVLQPDGAQQSTPGPRRSPADRQAGGRLPGALTPRKNPGNTKGSKYGTMEVLGQEPRTVTAGGKDDISPLLKQAYSTYVLPPSARETLRPLRTLIRLVPLRPEK